MKNAVKVILILGVGFVLGCIWLTTDKKVHIQTSEKIIGDYQYINRVCSENFDIEKFLEINKDSIVTWLISQHYQIILPGKPATPNIKQLQTDLHNQHI